MRGVVWVVLLFVAAVVAATALGTNDGLVTIAWGAWRTDLSLNLFVLLLVGFCGLTVLALQAIEAMVSLPRRAQEWRWLRRERAAQAALREALVEFFNARYSRARKAAQRALDFQPQTMPLAQDGEFRLLAQLLAANSLHRLQDRRQRDEVLQQAQHSQAASVLPRALGSAHEALCLCSAEWALDDRDAEAALRALERLPPGAQRRTQALRLKMQASRMARQPLLALQTARLLANHRAFSPAVAQGLLRSLAGEALEQVHDAEQLQRLWLQWDAQERRDPQVVALAAARAAKLGAAEEARAWLRPFWDRLADLSVVDRTAVALALADVRQGLGTDWLLRAELAAQTHAQDAAVVAAAGLVLAERQLWGKARPLLAQAATAAGLPAAIRRRAWRELAHIAAGQGDDAQARECERAAALLD
jgi:HemY protein